MRRQKRPLRVRSVEGCPGPRVWSLEAGDLVLCHVQRRVELEGPNSDYEGQHRATAYLDRKF